VFANPLLLIGHIHLGCSTRRGWVSLALLQLRLAFVLAGRQRQHHLSRRNHLTPHFISFFPSTYSYDLHLQGLFAFLVDLTYPLFQSDETKIEAR